MSQSATDGGVSLARKYADDLELSDEIRRNAVLWVKSAAESRKINRSDSVVAAGAIYAASIVYGDARSQQEVADITDVSTGSIRESYQEIMAVVEEQAQKKSEVPIPLRNNTPEAKILRKKVWKRLNEENQHFMAAVVGREGLGKSTTGLKIGEVCDPTFHAGRVMFEPKSFLERLQTWKEEGETKGKLVVADEAGVGLGTRTWYEKDQILFNQVLQVIRDENMGMIFTLPRLTELDSQTRGRLHALIEMTNVSPGNYATMKWFDWSPSRDERDRIYRSYPREEVGGVERQIRRLKLGPPTEELVKSYEDRKNEFQNELYQDAIDEMGEDVDDEKSVKEIAMEIANGDIREYISRHGNTNEPYLNKQLIRAEYEISHNDAEAVKSLLDRQFSTEELESHA